MYGVPKFKENFFMKYKKEVLLSVGAFLTIAIVVKFVPGQNMTDVKPILNDNRVTIEEVKEIVGYEVILNGVELGIVANENDIEAIVATAYEKMVQDLGYDPEIKTEPALIPVYAGALTLDTSDIAEGLKTEMINALGIVKEKAFVMRIGDDFTVALATEDAVKEVLAKAQMHFINADVELEINLETNEYNTMVLTPKVLMKETSEVKTILSTISEDGADTTEDATEEDELEAITEEAGSDETSEEVESFDPGTMLAIEFAENIAIVKAFVDPSELVDVETATMLITKENEEEKVYLVELGDCPSIIANDNDMKLTDLYKMNPGLKEQESAIHVGDPIVVMVPEPELKVETKVEIVYKEAIARATTYVDNYDEYVRNDSVIDNGSDGVLEVTALLTKVNGDETDREITNTEVLTEPKNKVVSKGRKPFPVKGATGTYVYPVTGFRISSPFGYRWGSFHHGIDLALGIGNPIMAADGGTVLFAGWKSSTYGYMVEIDHGNGVTTRYAHCSSISVVAGQAVSQYEQIAKVGSTGRSTGPHVHFEIRFNGTAANPANYLVY